MALPTSSMTLHGVFMEIMDTGVLLCGVSGIGKGELALELITRGHRLVADDAPEFRCDGDAVPEGICPPLLQDMLEVRGLGVLNIRALFGAHAVAPVAALALSIRLQNATPSQRALTPDYCNRRVLGHTLPEIVLPLLPGRNVALLVETLVRDFRLRRAGYNAAEDFTRRQCAHLGLMGEV